MLMFILKNRQRVEILFKKPVRTLVRILGEKKVPSKKIKSGTFFFQNGTFVSQAEKSTTILNGAAIFSSKKNGTKIYPVLAIFTNVGNSRVE